MNEIKDVYIKDEGDFATIIFQTKRSRKLIKENNELGGSLREGVGSSPSVTKLDIDADEDNLMCIEAWCISHNLSWESEF